MSDQSWIHSCSYKCTNLRCISEQRDVLVGKVAELQARLDAMVPLIDAADNYYRRYAQDEASEDGCEVTGCTLSQHEDAVALRDALTALEAA